MGEPNAMVPFALVVFLLTVAGCFLWLEPRRAMLFTMLGGWMFVPFFDGHYRVPVLNSKDAVVSVAVLLASLATDLQQWRRFRPAWLDLPVALVCLVPFATAIHNDLGAWEASASSFSTTMAWGAPYLLGRVYLGAPRAPRDFAEALIVAALVYAPFCLWEVRMSPNLHYDIYGFVLSRFDQVHRFGGYRPVVFMQHGLAVGMFMAVGTLTAYWLWRTDPRRRVAGIPLPWACAVLMVTTLLCKSTASILLLALGIAVLEGTRRLGTPALLLALMVLPSAYCAARISGWDAKVVVTVSGDLIDRERADSLQFRIRNEDLLIQKAMGKPWLGWGRFGRSFVYAEEGESLGAITDSKWIIALGFTGLLGLIAMGAALALPPLALLRIYPARYWGDPRLAPAASLAVAILLWAVDDLLNAMMSPVFPMIAGALVSLVLGVRTALPRQARAIFRPPSRRVAKQPLRT